jgi:hypothetical protein
MQMDNQESVTALCSFLSDEGNLQRVSTDSILTLTLASNALAAVQLQLQSGEDTCIAECLALARYLDVHALRATVHHLTAVQYLHSGDLEAAHIAAIAAVKCAAEMIDSCKETGAKMLSTSDDQAGKPAEQHLAAMILSIKISLQVFPLGIHSAQHS